jgi:hypothetical protein
MPTFTSITNAERLSNNRRGFSEVLIPASQHESQQSKSNTISSDRYFKSERKRMKPWHAQQEISVSTSLPGTPKASADDRANNSDDFALSAAAPAQ